MTVAVITLVTTLVGFFIWLIKRQAAIADAKTPADKVEDRLQVVHEEFAKNDGAGASARINEWVRRIKGGGSSKR